MGPGFSASVPSTPPSNFARPPTHRAPAPRPGPSWPGATLAIQGGIEGVPRPHTPPPGIKPDGRVRKKRRLPFKGLRDSGLPGRVDLTLLWPAKGAGTLDLTGGALDVEVRYGAQLDPTMARLCGMWTLRINS